MNTAVHKKNRGKKIALVTADRLFAGFQERLNALPSHKEFGVDVPLVLLFGSYLKRQPKVGDIDLALLFRPKPNFEERIRELGIGGVEGILAPHKEVIQFLKNRSSWLALHDFNELLLMKNVSFKVIHCAPEFQPLVDQLERRELTRPGFLRAANELKTEKETPS